MRANVSQHNPSSATTTVFPAKIGIYVAAHKSRSERTRQGLAFIAHSETDNGLLGYRMTDSEWMVRPSAEGHQERCCGGL